MRNETSLKNKEDYNKKLNLGFIKSQTCNNINPQVNNSISIQRYLKRNSIADLM